MLMSTLRYAIYSVFEPPTRPRYEEMHEIIAEIYDRIMPDGEMWIDTGEQRGVRLMSRKAARLRGLVETTDEGENYDSSWRENWHDWVYIQEFENGSVRPAQRLDRYELFAMMIEMTEEE